MKKISLIFTLFLINFALLAQDDLLDQIADDKKPEPVAATFKSTLIISGQSVETVAPRHLSYRVSHRFGTLNSGAYQAFGLDQGYIYMGFDYGISDKLMVGVGRSSEQKMLNFFSKFKLIQQETKGGKPVSVTLFGSVYVDKFKYSATEGRTNLSKYSYAAQALIARKFSSNFSMQLMPTFLHRNRNNVNGEENNIVSMGIAGRYKFTKRMAIIGEYYYVLPNQLNEKYKNALSIGFDIETGGHVFSLHFTNSVGMVEKQFVAETTDTWADGGIHFGFNLGRSFGLGKKAKAGYKLANQ